MVFANSSTTARARTASHPRTHPFTHPPCTAAEQHVQQYVSTFMHNLLMYRIGIYMFNDPPPYRGPGTAPSDAPCSPSLALRPVLSPIRRCAAVWGGRGAVLRPRGGRWRTEEPFRNGAHQNRGSFEDPKLHDDYSISGGYNRGFEKKHEISQITAMSCILRIHKGGSAAAG